jgi:WD40 repeat protein
LTTLPVDGFVSNLAFSQDGERLVAAVQWQALLVEWDLKSLELVQSYEIPKDVFFFTLSPDATTMLVDYGQPGLELWDLTAFASRRDYLKIIGASGFTRISPDNSMAAVWGYNDTDGNAAAVWDLRDETLLHEFTRGGKMFNSEWKSLEFSPDGHTIAISDDQGYIHLYELSSGKEIGSIHLDYFYKP